MFEFLFKRPGDKPDELPAGLTVQPDPSAQAGADQRAQQAEQVRQLAGNEAGAADFILHSDYSELRLAAAEFVHSREQLERVHAAMRNTDRRVAKMMQGRLDAIRHHQAELLRGQACIEQGRALLAEEKLVPNHVAELDRKWAVIDAPELAPEFGELRSALGQRLEAQVDLQRAMLDRLAELRRLVASGLPAADLAQQLDQLAQAHAAALAGPEHASLPKALVNEFLAEHARAGSAVLSLEQGQSAVAARAAALDQWQGADVAQLQAEQLKRNWNALPPLPEGEAAVQLQQRFEQLLATIPEVVRKPKQGRAAVQGPDQHFLDTLDAMEAALGQGALHAASDFDKVLKDSKAVRLSAPQSERLAHVRAELKRLSDWARWGGNVSREELVKAVEQLPSQKLSMLELAKKVGSMRERWKGLDSVSGAAPKSLWERFDAACSAAYAPAAAHFKHLADERHTNAAKAQALVAEAASASAALGEGQQIDWKHLAGTVQRLQLAWSHLGAIDRKEKKRLDADFARAMQALQAPLEGQRKDEIGRREHLIEQVAALDAHDRHALDTLRSAQERWQEFARALPLERKVEQAMWQRFRAACDAVFAKRKESAHAADAERRAHQEAKLALCARLEEAAAAGIDAAVAGKLLREVASEWHAIGAVPRAAEPKVEKRYAAAVAAIQVQLDAARRNAGLAQASALRDKLRVCQELEASLADADADAAALAPDAWAARWAALPALASDYERALQARFDAALGALAGDRAGYARLLEQNRAALLREVLRLEVLAGVDSGSEFARERLKMQVEALQSSLKSGQKPSSQGAQFLQLCALAALVDARTAARIEQLLPRLAREGR